MVSGPSFYIYGGGRWREVDISDGLVEGWGRTRFVYTKRGKLHMAKTRAVLAALRDLKADRRSAIRDGARLPHKKTEPPQKEERSPVTSKYDRSHHPRQSSNIGNPPSKPITQSEFKLTIGTQSATKIDAAIQTSLPSQTLTLPATLKQKSDKKHSESTSSVEYVPTKITTTAMVNSSPNKLAKLKIMKQWSLAGNVVSPKKKVPSLKLHKEDSTKYNLYKRKRSESSDSLVWVVLPKNEENEKSKLMHSGNENVQNKSYHMKRRQASTSSRSSQESRPQKIVKRTIAVADVEKFKVKNIKSSPNHAIKNIDDDPKLRKSGTTHIQSSDDVVISKSQLNTKSISNVEKIKPARQDKCKELIIDNSDVELLRNYLMHTGSDFDLLKFDQDDEYKKEFFYTINPLVIIERCQKIARMLRRGSQSEISLKDFASQLGLTTVSKRKVPKRYKMRNRILDQQSTDQSDYEIQNKNTKSLKNTVNKGSSDHARPEKYLKDTETDEDVTKSSSNKKSQDTDTSNGYGQRHSVGNRKEINRKNYVVEIFSPKKITAKSDENSSAEESRARVLRGKRKTDSTVNFTDTETYEVKKSSSKKKSQDQDTYTSNRYGQTHFTGNRKEKNRRNDVVDIYSSKKRSTKSDGDYSDEDSSEEEVNARVLRGKKKTDSTVNLTDTKTDEVKKSSSNKKSQGQDAHISNRYEQIHSVENRKETNRGNDVVKIFSSKKRSAKSDGDYSDEESSVEVKARVLRGKRKTGSNVHLDLILSDSERQLKTRNERDQTNKKNNNNKIKNNIDLTKSNDEDSDWAFETEIKRRSIRSGKRRNTDTHTNEENTEVESLKEVIKGERNKNNKIDETEQTDKQIDANVENVGETSRMSKTPQNRRRNSKGRYLKHNPTIKNKSTKVTDADVDHVGETSRMSKTPQNHRRNSKGRYVKHNPTIKSKSTKVASVENSESDDKPLKTAKTRKQENNINYITTNNKNTENSEEEFESKVAKGKIQNKLNNTNNNMSKFKENSIEQFESQKKVKSLQRNKINVVKNDNNDRNNNMTDTNDENSEAEERKTETSTKQSKEQKITKKLSEEHKTTKKSQRWMSSLYSNLEDHAIVAWVSLGGRAQCVNGNRIWKELQNQYHSIAGQHRTWHSLRNRYLRGILPNLGQLALNPSLVARLRAAAATGEIKTRNDPNRRNSIFGAPVKGALSRRPRAVRSPTTDEELPPKRHRHDHTRKRSVSNPRVLRSSLVTSSPEKARPAPSYSDITRHFAATHRESSPNSSRASPERVRPRNTSLETKKSEKISLDTKKSDKGTLETKKSDKSLLQAKKSDKSMLETKKSEKSLLETKSSSKNNPGSLERKMNQESSTVTSSATKLSSATKTSSATNESANKARKRSLRSKSPARESEKPPERGRTKIRRLYNPSSMI